MMMNQLHLIIATLKLVEHYSYLPVQYYLPVSKNARLQLTRISMKVPYSLVSCQHGEAIRYC